MPELELKKADVPQELARLLEQVRILKEDNAVLKEQVRYWKWQAVGWGAPDYENFEAKQ